MIKITFVIDSEQWVVVRTRYKRVSNARMLNVSRCEQNERGNRMHIDTVVVLHSYGILLYGA